MEKSMHKERTELNILFHRILPERVLEWIREGHTIREEKFINSHYTKFSTMDMQEYSAEEIAIRYDAMSEKIHHFKETGIFHLLSLYAEDVLQLNGDTPVCKLNKILNWNTISKNLGQDLFTTAWMAYHDLERYRCTRKQQTFAWPSVLKTDDKRLTYLFQKGLAENHYHLHGSTQSFSISWACIMNHPEDAEYIFDKNYEENLSHSLLKSSKDIMMDWPKRMRYAAFIRMLLFKRCLGQLSSTDVSEKFAEFDILPLVEYINTEVDTLRFLYGYKFNQPIRGRRCLDYAITDFFYNVDEKSHNRLLTGERNFLYQCFIKIYSGEFTYFEESLFYVYILIKSNFRSEMIQNNDKVGFSNFSDYQRRKNQVYEKYDEYWTEAQRLSVCVAVDENNVESLEVRIMPNTKFEKIHCTVNDIDMKSNFAIENVNEKFFYVIHFPKGKFSKKEFAGKDSLVPRNVYVRRRTKNAAIALAKYFENHPYEKQRIYGIDACSQEIGCRPEIFATEFRYLRECSKIQQEQPWYKDEWEQNKELGITYHVGEDFLDILDGLRAIDEAILFLQMKKGDRLGHAIALGIDAEKYYNFKRRSIYLTKQDCLDNYIWILYRSIELGICIDPRYRTILKRKARLLLHDIFPKLVNKYADNLDLYYYSWKLRGDNPSLYESGKYSYDQIKGMIHTYYNSMKIKDDELEYYRGNEGIASYLYFYHYNSETKENGLIPEEIVVEDWYIALVQQLQKAMQHEIAKKGLVIECNPTSNLRISPIQEYKEHPILVFNNTFLEQDTQNPHLCVTINTDDIGVFDTSLENEYALMYEAICGKRHLEGNMDDYAVEQYLDYIRNNGLVMAFKIHKKP